jgi:hypothetical protein
MVYVGRWSHPAVPALSMSLSHSSIRDEQLINYHYKLTKHQRGKATRLGRASTVP